MKPVTLFHFQLVLQNAKQFWSLKRSHDYGICMGCHRDHWSCPALQSCGDLSHHSGHRQDDCNCGLFAISDHTKINFRALWYKRVVKTTQIVYCGSFRYNFFVSRDLFTDLTVGEARILTFIPRLSTASSRVQICTYRKIITYQDPQSNLPAAEIWLLLWTTYQRYSLHRPRSPFLVWGPIVRTLPYTIPALGRGTWRLHWITKIMREKSGLLIHRNRVWIIRKRT